MYRLTPETTGAYNAPMPRVARPQTPADRAAGDILTRARKHRRLSQSAVGRRVGEITGEDVGHDWIARIEAGPPCPLTNHHRLWVLFKVLGVDPQHYLATLGLGDRRTMWLAP